MSDLQKNYDDEIDLLDLIEKVWNGKWKIALFIIVGIFIAFGYNIIKVNNFIFTTEIRPITTFEVDKYRLFNESLKEIKEGKVTDIVFQITNKSLLSQYIEEIEEGTLLEVGIEKFNLFNKDSFDNEKAYIEKVKKFASEILVLKPQNIDGKEKRDQILYHTIKGEYTDIEKWKELLAFVDFEANKNVKDVITNRFEMIISVQKQKRDFQIKDLEILIENEKKDFDKRMEEFELLHQFKLEDLTTQINNAITDYDRITKDRLAFLIEQATIARKLDVKKNTIETQSFNTSNSVISNFKTDNPFYLRGYEAIEEEIRLINARKDKTSFIKNLFALEQQKLILEQDQTLQRAEQNKIFLKTVLALEVKKRALEQNQNLQRATVLFANSPLKQDAFKATLVNVSATEYVTNHKSILYYILAIILSGMIGVFYVLIANAFTNRKKTIVTS